MQVRSDFNLSDSSQLPPTFLSFTSSITNFAFSRDIVQLCFVCARARNGHTRQPTLGFSFSLSAAAVRVLPALRTSRRCAYDITITHGWLFPLRLSILIFAYANLARSSAHGPASRLPCPPDCFCAVPNASSCLVLCQLRVRDLSSDYSPWIVCAYFGSVSF